MTGLNKGFNTEIKAVSQEPIQGVAANATYDSVLTTQGSNVDYPLRMYASATPDKYLNFSASTTATGDGATKLSAPIGGVGPATTASGKIALGDGTGAVTGMSGMTISGVSFATTFSAVAAVMTAGQWLRVVFAQQYDGTVTASLNLAASQGALPDYGAQAALLGGNFLGYTDLTADAASSLRTSGQTSSSQKVGNEGIYRAQAGGGGGSVSAALAVQSVSTPNVTLTSGFFPLQDGRVCAASDGVSNGATTDYASSLTVSLNTILASSPSALGGGGATPTNATVYHLYLDLDALATTPNVISSGTETGRRVYPVTVASFILSTTGPDQGINRARYVHRGTIKSATTGNVWSGTGAEAWAAPTLQGNNGPVATSLVASRPATGSVVGSVGSAGQIAAGHALSSKSFPSGCPAADVSWFPLTSVNDGSANGHNLTNNGTTPFTGTDINGVAQTASLNGTSQYFSSTASFFNAATFACGGWFAPTTWTPAGVQFLFGNHTSGADRAFEVVLQTNGTLLLNATNTAGSWDSGVSGGVLGFSAGSYHHIAVLSNGTTVTLYVDGQEYLQITQVVRTLTSAYFAIGAALQSGTNEFFAGKINQFFFVAGFALQDADIGRTKAYRYDHNAAVTAANQRWSAKTYPNGGEPATQPTGWLISAGDSNSVFWDFSDLGSADAVDVYLEDMSLSPFVIPAVSPYDNIFTTALPASVAHGQVDVPEVVVLVEDGTAGEWAPVSGLDGKIRVDATNIYFDGPLPTPAASPNRLWVVARTRRLSSVSVPDANSSRSGVVTTSAQTFAGTKTFNGAIDAAGGFAADSAAYATASVPGLVSTAAQTVAGDKTFTGSLTRSGEDAIWAFSAAGVNTLSSATLAPVVFTAQIDQSAAFASNTYTCKKAGIYRVAFDGSLNKTSGTSTAGDFWNINIRKNGAAINSAELQMSMGYATGQDFPFHTELLVSLAVNDTITVAIVYNAGGARTWVGTADNVNLIITKI